MTRAKPAFQRAVVEKLRTGEARRPLEAIRLVKKEQIAEQSAVMPSGKFRVVYADPPFSASSLPDRPIRQDQQGHEGKVMSLYFALWPPQSCFGQLGFSCRLLSGKIEN